MLNAYWLAFAVGGEVVDLVNQTGFVAKTVLLILLAFSILSWAIILSKWNLLRRARVQSGRFVRAFRKAGIDLQKEVHEDMTRAWSDYPKKWGARGTDTNIDHRRVLNLTTYLDRQGKSLPITNDRADYLPGDVVAWELSDGVEHIGILTNLLSEADKHYLIVHNIGAGARVEDVLMTWKIIGHYRYF